MNYNKKWRERNPQKTRAHWIVSNAIKYGKLKRLPCEKCGNNKSHAHHADYSKPLEIKWLCHKCHWIEHGWIKKAKSTNHSKSRLDAKKPYLFDKAEKLRDAGYSYENIAISLNCSKGTIYKWLNNTLYK